MPKIMVLNDGETFTNLKDCAIVDVPDEWDNEQIEAALPHMNGSLLSIALPNIEEALAAIEQDPKNHDEHGTLTEQARVAYNAIAGRHAQMKVIYIFGDQG